MTVLAEVCALLNAIIVLKYMSIESILPGWFKSGQVGTEGEFTCRSYFLPSISFSFVVSLRIYRLC